MTSFLAHALIIVGGFLLAASLYPIGEIMRLVPKGRLRSYWLALRGLAITLLVAYAAYYWLEYGTSSERADWAAEVIFAACGTFIFLVSLISRVTTQDILRIATLEQDVLRDPLTGAFNRRYLDHRLDYLVSNAHRLQAPLAALLIDLDHFKHVNDTYGHPVGDRVLYHVCHLILSYARSDDIVVRYGGEEFLLLAPNTPINGASTLAEGLTEGIRGSLVSLPGGNLLSITASVGVCELLPAETAPAFIERADVALYAAKREGRNRYRRWDRSLLQITKR